MNDMSRKYSPYSILLIGLMYVIPAYSQSIEGLRFPFGIPLQSGTGLSLSMGGSGIGISNDILGMSENPANLGAVGRAVFSAHGSLDFTNIKDDGKATNHITFNPHILSFCFPIKKLGSLGFSITQTGNAESKFMIDQRLPISEFDVNGRQGLIREGSSIVWQAGWGYSIKRYAKIGLAYQRMYFNPSWINVKLTEGDINDSLLDSSSISFVTNGISAGIQVPIKKLTLGISGQYFFENDASYHYYLSGTKVKDSTLSSQIETENYNFAMRPAPSIGFGASYQISPEWLCAADFEATIWSKYISKFNKNVDNAYGFSAGTQYVPAPNLLTPKYYEIMQYRAGFRFNQLPVSTVSEAGISFGIGLPLREGGGIFDIFFEYGQRWDKDISHYKEEFFKIQLGFNAGRKWYQSSDTNY